MGIDIGGNTITLASSVLTVNTGVPMNLLSTGGIVRPHQPMFIAQGVGTAAWVYPTSQAWTKMAYPTANRNDDACFDHALSRFTAPVDGWYFFQASNYLLKDSATAGYYWHPVFYVNGGHGRNVNTTYTNYRIRGHGWAVAGYADAHITQAYALIAGDYVEHYVYSTSGAGTNTNRHYPPYARFTGFLLG